MSADPWYIQYSNQILAILGIIIASALAIYFGLKQKRSSKRSHARVGVENSSGQIQQIEKANNVIQARINYLPDSNSKMGITEVSKPKTETIKIEEQNNKVEAISVRKVEAEKKILLPDTSKITKLVIKNEWLTKLYDEVSSNASTIYHDAQLRSFTIQVLPFREIGQRVNIY